MNIENCFKNFNKFVEVLIVIASLAAGVLFGFDFILGFFHAPWFIVLTEGFLVAISFITAYVAYNELKKNKQNIF